MRSVMLLTAACVLVACNAERAVKPRPEPQKAALRMWGTPPCGAPPLLFINGTRVDFATADLESLKIEQVDVLKGASAIRLYGEDAKNGVVLIKTGKRD